MAVELADVEAAADLRTYLERARRFDPEGAARLQSTPTALAVWTCARPGSGLLGEGVVLGLRVLPLADAPAAPVDECHPIGALLDRLTHHVSILAMNGDSYRLRQSAGRRRATAAAEQNQATPDNADPETGEIIP